MYCIVILSLQWLCKLDKLSKEVVDGWKYNAHRRADSVKYFARLIRAQKPVSQYYAMTKFDKDTQTNYFDNIVNYTVNAILLY